MPSAASEQAITDTLLAILDLVLQIRSACRELRATRFRGDLGSLGDLRSGFISRWPLAQYPREL